MFHFSLLNNYLVEEEQCPICPSSSRPALHTPVQMSQLCPQLHRGRARLSHRPGPAGPHTPCPGPMQEGEVGGGVCIAFVCLLRAREAETEVT